MCPPMRAHWRRLANTIKLVLPSTHPSPQPKRHLDRFSRIGTVPIRVSSGMSGCHPPQDCLFPLGICIQSNTWFLGSTRLSIPNCISIGSAVFAQITAGSRYTLQWAPLFPKIAPSHAEMWTPSNTWFLWPTRVLNRSTQTASRSVQSFLQGSIV